MPSSKHNGYMLTDAGPRPPLTPRHWLGWLAVGFIFLLGKIPVRLGVLLSVPLGALMRLTMTGRRRIAKRNIERCFSEMTAKQRQGLLRACFRSIARAVFETAWCWSMSERQIRRLGYVEGLEYVEAARQGGRGLLVITAHITCLEMGARIAAQELDGTGIYRPLRSPVLEWYQNRCRLAYGATMISKRKIRSAIRILHQGGIIWYAPDQDFGAKKSVFAPFFGIQTATLLAPHRMAQLTGCAVMTMFPVYDENSRQYIVRLQPALESFPGPDAVTDLARINRIMEEHIRAAPEQYWWIHRRFKTRPPGEQAFYQ